MLTYAKLAIATLVAAAALGALVGSASANRLSLTSRTVRVVWSSLEFAGPTTIRCRVTMEGTFHESTVSKVSGSLIGYITAASIARPCTGGTAWAYNGTERNEALGNTVLASSLPWIISYEAFIGELPAFIAEKILIIMLRWLYRASFFGIPILCAYRSGGANGNITGTNNVGAGGVVTSMGLSGRVRSETGGCPEGSFTSPAGDGVVTQLGNSNRISVTLI